MANRQVKKGDQRKDRYFLQIVAALEESQKLAEEYLDKNWKNLSRECLEKYLQVKLGDSHGSTMAKALWTRGKQSHSAKKVRTQI